MLLALPLAVLVALACAVVTVKSFAVVGTVGFAGGKTLGGTAFSQLSGRLLRWKGLGAAAYGNREGGFDERDRGSDDSDRRGFDDRQGRGFDQRKGRGYDDRDRRGSDERESRGFDQRDRRGSDERDRRSFDEREGRGFNQRDRRGSDERDRRGFDQEDRRGFDDRVPRGNDEGDRRGYDETDHLGSDADFEAFEKSFDEAERASGRADNSREKKKKVERRNLIRLKDVKVGEEYNGTVGRWWREWAVNVDIGANGETLLMMEEFCDGFPLEGWPPATGTKVTVRILERTDKDVLVTMRPGDFDRLPPSPKGSKDVSIFKEVDSEQWFNGEVQGMAAFGVFVLVQPPGDDEQVVGLLRKEGFADGFAPTAERGEKIRVRVVDIDSKKKRMGLSMRDPEDGEFRGR